MSTEGFSMALKLTHGYDPSVSSKERLHAEEYLMQLREMLDGLNLSFHIINNEPVNEIRCFWAFNTIMHHLTNITATASAAQAEELYRTLFSFIYRYLFSSPTVTPVDYLVNKHAQVMVAGLQMFYPRCWTTFFDDVLELLMRSNALPATADMVMVYFLRIFQYIDERVVSIRDRTDQDKELRARSMEIKDAMREGIIPRVVDVWYSTLCDGRLRSPEIANVCLSVVQAYVEWIDVTLLMTADWINLLYYLVTVPSLRIAACECLLSLVEKKQLPGVKMDSLRMLNVVDSLPRVVAMLDVPPSSDEDVAFIEVVTHFVVGVAGQFTSLHEICTDLLQSGTSPSLCSTTADGLTVQDLPFSATPDLLEALAVALHAVVAQLLRLFRLDMFEVHDIAMPFIQTYVKSKVLLETEAAVLLSVIFEQSCITGMVTDVSLMWDDTITDKRKVLHNLARLIHRRYPALVQQQVQELVYNITHPHMAQPVSIEWSYSPTHRPNESATNPNYHRSDVVEAVLRYVYEMGEVVKPERLRHADDPATQMLLQVLTSEDVIQMACPCVHLAFFEVMDRYYPFFVYHPDHIETLLQRILLLPCGVTNDCDRVRSRVCYLLGHLIQMLRPRLKPFAANMVAALVGVVPLPLLSPSDRRELYECVGTLLPLATSSEENGSDSHAAVVQTASQGLNGYATDDAPQKSFEGGEGSQKEASLDSGSRLGLVRDVLQTALDHLLSVSNVQPQTAMRSECVADGISYLTSISKGIGGSGGGSVSTSDSNGVSNSLAAISRSPNNTGSVSASGEAKGGSAHCQALSSSMMDVAVLLQGITEQVMDILGCWHDASIVRERTGQFLHQMVNILPFGMLNDVFERYVEASLSWMVAVPELSRLLRVMYQFVNKSGGRCIDWVVKVTPTVWHKMGEVGAVSDESQTFMMGVVSEAAREKLDVYKQFFVYLFMVLTWGCAESVLLIPLSDLQEILGQLLYALTLPVELELSKSALQTLTKCALECCGRGPTPMPTECLSPRTVERQQHTIFLESYCLEEVLPTALGIVLRPTFDLKDAKSFLVVGEVCQLCKSMVGQLGEAALQVIYNTLLPLVDSSDAMPFCVALRDEPRLTVKVKMAFREMLVKAQMKMA